MMLNQVVKTVRYIPEQMMGVRKFRTRRRIVAAFIPNSTQRKKNGSRGVMPPG